MANASRAWLSDRVRRGPGKAGPHVELGGTDGVGVGDVDPSHGADLPEAGRVLGGHGVLRGSHGRRLGLVADQVGVGGVEQHQRPRAQPLALPGGDRGTGERAPVLHHVDVELERSVGRRPPGEDRVDRLDLLGRVDGGTGQDRLGQELAAEDDGASPEHDARSREGAFPGRLEVEHGEQVGELRHGWVSSGGGSAGSTSISPPYPADPDAGPAAISWSTVPHRAVPGGTLLATVVGMPPATPGRPPARPGAAAGPHSRRPHR